MDGSGAKTRTSGGDLTLKTDSFTMDDQVFNSISSKIPAGKPFKSGSSICILNSFTFFITIIISVFK